jgi:bifunctional isochorismate lyase/aryl carrier protein
MTAGGELSLDRLRSDVAELLGVPAATLVEDASLPEQGLDSIRLMSLVERWRAAGGAVTFAELAERPTLKDWNELLASRTDQNA